MPCRSYASGYHELLYNVLTRNCKWGHYDDFSKSSLQLCSIEVFIVKLITFNIDTQHNIIILNLRTVHKALSICPIIDIFLNNDIGMF